MSISILILTYQRLELLKICLASALREFPHAQILVWINGDDQKTYDHLLQYFPQVQVKKEDKRNLGEARNRALQFIQNDWIFFLDDDAELSLGYGEHAKKLIQDNLYDVFGGPDITNLNPTLFQASLGIAMGSFLVSGSTLKRHSVHGEDEVLCKEDALILCNLWMKKSLLKDFKFPEDMMRNEENVLLHELSKNGFKFAYSPKIWLYHYRKTNLKANLKAVFSSGFHRALSIKNDPGSFRLQYIIPSLFIFFLIFSFFLNPKLFFLTLSFYILVLLCEALRFGFLYGFKTSPFLLIHFTSMHFTYGLGFLRGLL